MVKCKNRTIFFNKVLMNIYGTESGMVTNDTAGEQYFLRVQDLPDGEKPRERLIAHGPQALASHELLAVVMNVGTCREGVLSMAKRMMHEYGEKAFVSETNAGELSKQLGIPLTKACQAVACFELGRRYFQNTREGGQTIRNAGHVHAFVRDMHELPKEHLRGLYLDTHYRVIKDEVISIGSVDSSPIHPREVFRPAIAVSASAIILVHNHPSGVRTPSEADIEVTRQVIAAGKLIGIDVLDHVIVTRDGYTSIVLDHIRRSE